MGSAINCECGCSNEAPAAEPWFLNTMIYLPDRSSFYSPKSCHGTQNMFSTSFKPICGIVMSCWGSRSRLHVLRLRSFYQALRPPTLCSPPSICKAGNLFGTTRNVHPAVSGRALGNLDRQVLPVEWSLHYLHKTDKTLRVVLRWYARNLMVVFLDLLK